MKYQKVQYKIIQRMVKKYLKKIYVSKKRQEIVVDLKLK